MLIKPKRPESCLEFQTLISDQKKLESSPTTLENVGQFVDNACYFRCAKSTREECWKAINIKK